MLSRDGDGDETTPRSGPSPSGTDVGRSWADVSRGTPGDGSSGRSRRGGENDKLVDLRGRRIAKNSFYVWMDALVVVSGIQNTHTNATLGNVRIRLADNFQQREGRWEGVLHCYCLRSVETRRVEVWGSEGCDERSESRED